jgi:hypothetical protein
MREHRKISIDVDALHHDNQHDVAGVSKSLFYTLQLKLYYDVVQ